MQKIFLGLALLAMPIFMNSCVTIPKDAPPYTRVDNPPTGYTHVYFYRPPRPLLFVPSVLVDDKLIFEPPSGSYTLITLPAGSHTVNIKWDWADNPDLEFPIDLIAGDSIYIKILTTHEQHGFTLIYGSVAQPVPQDEAEKDLIQCCRYIAPKNFKEQTDRGPVAHAY